MIYIFYNKLDRYIYYCPSQWHAEIKFMGVLAGCQGKFSGVGMVFVKIPECLIRFSIIEGAEHATIFSPFLRVCWWECVFFILNFFMLRINFAPCWRNFQGCSRGVVNVKVSCSWIIKGAEHTLIFKALYPGCQHGVAERVSLRGAVILDRWSILPPGKETFFCSKLTFFRNL